MNLYDLHPEPETLKGYEQRFQVPKLAYEEARKRSSIGEHGKAKRSPDLEPAIARNPQTAYNYAKEVIGGRFPLGEPTMAKHPEVAGRYAVTVLRSRFPEGEAAIATDPYWSYHYARYVIKGRFPEGEVAIAKSKWYVNDYNERFGTKL